MIPPHGFERWPPGAQDAWWDQELDRLDRETNWIGALAVMPIFALFGMAFLFAMATLWGGSP